MYPATFPCFAHSSPQVRSKSILSSQACAVFPLLLVIAVFGRLIYGQNAPSIHVGGVDLTGIPEDWSHRYIVFSDPGTEEKAIQSGDYGQWERAVNEPRYVIQQLNRHAGVQGPAAVDVEYRSRWEAAGPENTVVPEAHSFGPISMSEQIPQPNFKSDWSQALGGPGLAAGHYPAKYSFSITTASCSDYVIFPTGATGSATHATIVAFTNIYVGTGGCAASEPTVDWAYNTGTGATANLSPVLSLNGTQVAFIQTSSSVASLVILKMASSGGSVTAPAAATSVTATNYRDCTAPCYVAITLNSSPNDTNSAPFYRYDGSDTLYVGDNKGKLHQFTGVFDGTPSETMTNGWPATASTETSPNLTSPIYDSGSTLVFMGDASGYLHSVTTAGTTRTVLTSNQMACGTAGMVDAPIIDSTTEQLYVFVGDGCDATPGNSYANRFATGTSISASYGENYVSLKNASTNGASTISRAGAFDNLYYTGTGNTGNLYVCVNGTLYQITMATFSGTGTVTENTFDSPVSTVSGTATCSPVTEFRGAKASTTLTASLAITGNPLVASTTGIAVNDYLQIGSEIMRVLTVTPALTVLRAALGTIAVAHTADVAVTDIEDWAFVSVQGDGNVAPCTGTTTSACIYNYNITAGGTSGTPTAGLAAIGGTSGIIIDNQSTTQVGAQQVYFSTLGGDTAVQASQSSLH